MNELLRDIEEDVRRERAERLWHRFGKFAIVVSIAIITVTMAVVLLQNHRRAQAEEDTTQFLRGAAALDAKDYKTAIAEFDALVKKDSSLYGPAMLRKAQAQTASGDSSGAAETYRTLAMRADAFGALAQMQVADLKPITPDKESAFYYTQSERTGWQLVQQGEKGEAVTLFTRLRDDPQAPYALRQRLVAALRYLAPGSAKAAEYE